MDHIYSKGKKKPTLAVKLYPAGLTGATREDQAHKGEWQREDLRRQNGVRVSLLMMCACEKETQMDKWTKSGETYEECIKIRFVGRVDVMSQVKDVHGEEEQVT